MSSRAPRLAVALETSTARPSLAVRRGERLEEARAEFGLTGLYRDYRAMLKEAEPDQFSVNLRPTPRV